ncbi:MAG: F420-dependent methylenetetrahydromethanopterin dehydrogenase [Candidatus Bathyarchaeota archaeon]|jgi:methylenetetrahydromethanopterin dehydrogenase
MDKVKIVVFKCGNIASSPLFELLLDELADRKDIDTRTIGTGSKMTVESVQETLPKALELHPNMLILICPNPAIGGPAKVRETLSKNGVPCVVVSDSPAKRIKEEIAEQGLGYIIVNGDPLIGARREFLDPIEMAIFNSNILKVLAITGAYRIIQEEMDNMINALKTDSSIVLPKLIISIEKIRTRSDFVNPYARAKAMAAYALTEKIAEINFKACFVEKNPDKYISLAASAHEIAQVAAALAEEAREIEKSNDSVVRRPHSKSGKLKTKTKLLDLPTNVEQSTVE